MEFLARLTTHQEAFPANIQHLVNMLSLCIWCGKMNEFGKVLSLFLPSGRTGPWFLWRSGYPWWVWTWCVRRTWTGWRCKTSSAGTDRWNSPDVLRDDTCSSWGTNTHTQSDLREKAQKQTETHTTALPPNSPWCSLSLCHGSGWSLQCDGCWWCSSACCYLPSQWRSIEKQKLSTILTAAVKHSKGKYGGCKAHLVVEVIQISWDKNMNIPHYLQNVQPLKRKQRNALVDYLSVPPLS